MPGYNFQEILNIAKRGTDKQWLAVAGYLKDYNGSDDDVLGLKLYLEDHHYDKIKLLEFESELEKTPFPATGSRLVKIPTWALVMAASIVLAGGLYINSAVQRKSLHILEAPLPVYLSNTDMAFNKAMSLYKKADYEKASFLFRELGSDTATYYGAVCYELLNYFELSKSALERIEAHSCFYNKAQIRLAAIAVDEGNKKLALKLVHKIRPGDKDEVERIKSIKARLK